jgi:hypothetical protein
MPRKKEEAAARPDGCRCNNNEKEAKRRGGCGMQKDFLWCRGY